jgi:hypothetical protein
MGLSDTGGDVLADARTGKNGQHYLVGLLRQSVFGRLAGYEDMNDADRLCRDRAMRWVVGDRAIDGTATCASMSSAGSDDAPATTAEVRPGAGKAARFSASVQSTGWFAHLLRMRYAIYCCPRRPNGRSWPTTARNPGNVG